MGALPAHASGTAAPKPPWTERIDVTADGGAIVFVSRAGNLVPDDTNTWWDTFVRHLGPGS
ncbi:hypothetical protein [Streptomyces sp. NPDC021622]|uniref:hypothetical protein n=1 Tax=Streptomyces sp. NPDC021622 TaxID=3155013 RepID=UPI00340ABACE